MSTSRRSEDTRNLGLTSTSFKQDPMIEKKNKKIERERETKKKRKREQFCKRQYNDAWWGKKQSSSVRGR